jgi:NADH-quinone oxidoreductase subunit G
VARLKPRFNDAVNRWWLCDEGRYGFGSVDDPSRIATPLRRAATTLEPVAWDVALDAVARALTAQAPDGVGVLASPKMANEDLFALRRLLERLAITRAAVGVPPRTPGTEDDLLRRADKNPNTRGAEAIGFPDNPSDVLAAARDGRLSCLWVFHDDLLESGWPAAEVVEALRRVRTLIFTGPNANATSARAHLVLPAAAWVEREGTFTSFEGRVQRFRVAVPPLGEARPEWELLGQLLGLLGDPTDVATRAEHWFRRLADAVPAFHGLSYRSIGDGGQLLAERT